MNKSEKMALLKKRLEQIFDIDSSMYGACIDCSPNAGTVHVVAVACALREIGVEPAAAVSAVRAMSQDGRHDGHEHFRMIEWAPGGFISCVPFADFVAAVESVLSLE